jgi:hypothetical protein
LPRHGLMLAEERQHVRVESVDEVMLGGTRVVSQRLRGCNDDLIGRRPAIITLFPSLWRASASPRPMPEPPPVMKTVLPLSLMVVSFGISVRMSGRKALAEHRHPAHGLGSGRFVLQNVPVFGELTVLEAHDIGGNPGGGTTIAGEAPSAMT